MKPGQSKTSLTLDSTVQSPQVFSVQPPSPVQPPSASSISRAIPSSSALANPLPPSAVKTPLSKVASPLTALRNTTPKLASPVPASPLIENPRGSIMVSDTAVTNTSKSSVSESARTQAPPTPMLQVTTPSVSAQSCASGVLASSPKPTTPATSMAETASSIPPFAMSSSAKPASRPRKKPKLGKDKSLLVNSSLVQEDLTWFSTKQGKTSELSATSASAIVVKEEHKSPSLSLNPLPDVSASKKLYSCTW
ncbi:hypothetical protein DFH11DRAFT_474182 [Phellopilus nigrolimitatus]|nr:hypothetical protein DFH11DRAFT_474182 [Phellopilus nigrolimitatus]